MMTYIYHFTASGLEVFTICCMLSILRQNYWNIKKIISITIILSLITTLLDEWEIDINIGGNLLLSAVMIKLFYHYKVFEAVFDAVCSVTLVATVEMLTTMICCYIDPLFFEDEKKVLIYLVGIVAFFLMILKATRKRKKIWFYYQKYQSSIWVICFNFILIQLAEMYNWNQTETMNISIVALVLAAVISNMLLAFKLIKNQQQKEELNKQKELMELKESFLQQMAAEQHDFAKHLRAIKSLLNVSEDRERRSEAAAYVEELIAEREGKKSMMYAGDGILSAILHDKRKEAERKGVAFHVLARQTEKKLPLSQTELVELVVNLLDNAFEAVERMETERRKVFFEIGERRGTVFLQTINSLPEESPAAEQMLERGVSTKRGHLRGYGLANVKNIVEAHGGRLEIQKNDEIIVICVLFQ